MRLRFTWWLAMVCGWPMMAGAQLQLLASREPQCVFAGPARNISVTFTNPDDVDFASEIGVRIFQTTSATAAPLGDRPWKKLQVRSRQTVLENAALDFPAVKAETPFLVQWLADTNRVLGKTDVLVYPTNLLDEFKPMLAGANIGVLDPNGLIKPLLKKSGVGVLDLGEMALEDFSGKLAVVGPFQTGGQMRAGLPEAIQRIASKGVAVVWILPPANPQDEIKPSFYVVPEGKGAVVIVQPDLVADFSENPRSQLNLICFCKLALKPEPPALPNVACQP